MAIEMMSISHCYCSDYMTKPTQFGDEPKKIAIVVTPHIPKANLKFQKFEKMCIKHGAKLIVINSGMMFPLY